MASDPCTGLARLESSIEREARHLGAHYTPYPIVRRMVRAVLGPLCRGRSPEAILRLRILDPAVGSGRFLLAALDFLAEAAGRGDGLRAAIATACLHGIDVHEPAADLARDLLAQAAGCAPADLARTIIAADSLLADIPSALGVPAFDAVLTNPPWISYSGRQARALPREARRRLAGRFAAFRSWPTAHGAFLELAAGLLAPGGRAALLVPHQVCHLPGYEATRRAALERCRFDPPPEPLGEACFPGVVQPAAIVHLHCVPAAGEEPPQRAGPPREEGPQASILRRMRRHEPAPPRTFTDPGVHSGNSARLIVHDAPGEGRAPLREGRCIQPFFLDEPRRWLTVEPHLPEGCYFRIRGLAAYRDARLLLRQTASRPIAARHAEPTYFRNSVLACRGIDGLADAAFLGLLNSTLLAFAHRCWHADSRQRAFPQVKVGHLQALPIARDAADLEPLALRMEALAAERGAVERALAEQFADLLGPQAAALLRARVPSLLAAAGHSEVEAVRRRAPAVSEALRSARAAAGPLFRALAEQARLLDHAVYRLYGLTQAEIDWAEAAMSGHESARGGPRPR